MSQNRKFHLHEATVFWGMLVGFFLGAIVWMFRLPKRGEDTRQDMIETGRKMIRRDPVSEEDNALNESV